MPTAPLCTHADDLACRILLFRDRLVSDLHRRRPRLRKGRHRRYAVKLSSTYRAPLDFSLGLRYSYESGRPYGRLIIVRGLGQGNVTMLAEPRGNYSLPAVNDFQVRIDKDLRITGTQRLRLSLDVFNIFNSDTVLTLRNNSSQVTATTPWAQTLSIVRPRTVQLGFRYQF